VRRAPPNCKLSYLGLGLAGEASEVVGELKKLMRGGRFDTDRIADELVDVIYYCHALRGAGARAIQLARD